MKKQGHLLYFVGSLIGLLASFTIFFPALGYESSNASFTGVQIISQHAFASLGLFGSGYITFSIFSLLAYLLSFVASIVLIYVKRGYFLSFVCFVASFALFFLMKDITKIAITVFNTTTYHSVGWSMEYGVYVALVLTGLGIILTLFQSVLDFKK